jgi:hypothetical protein
MHAVLSILEQYWSKGPEFFVSITAFMMSWSFWGAFTGWMTTVTSQIQLIWNLVSGWPSTALAGFCSGTIPSTLVFHRGKSLVSFWPVKNNLELRPPGKIQYPLWAWSGLQTDRQDIWIMPSSWIWHHVCLVWTNIPPKRRFTQDIHSATFQKDGILHSHCHENLKS